MCGECSVGHCPECGTQMIPFLPAAATATGVDEDTPPVAKPERMSRTAARANVEAWLRRIA